jgi:uncharacterized membrane protein
MELFLVGLKASDSRLRPFLLLGMVILTVLIMAELNFWVLWGMFRYAMFWGPYLAVALLLLLVVRQNRAKAKGRDRAI